ncbi:MAG TPA: XRE family transcriptional regulator [Pseudolabrys sp.]|nr:XRE family transcriptional regulator [Pseudolabrys sp.]
MMDIRAIHTDEDYEWALKEVEQYFDNVPASGTPEADRFDVLSTLIADYEKRQFGIPDADPIEILEFAIESMGKTQAELGHLITRSRATEILQRKRPLTLQMIRIISEAWHIPIEALAAPYELQRKDNAPTARPRELRRHVA